VKCWGESYLTGGRCHVSSAYLTFVAINRQGDRIAVPPVIPETVEEKRRYDDAGRRRELRRAELGRKQARGE